MTLEHLFQFFSLLIQNTEQCHVPRPSESSTETPFFWKMKPTNIMRNQKYKGKKKSTLLLQYEFLYIYKISYLQWFSILYSSLFKYTYNQNYEMHAHTRTHTYIYPVFLVSTCSCICMNMYFFFYVFFTHLSVLQSIQEHSKYPALFKTIFFVLFFVLVFLQ